jgi:hypothetical protein
MNSYPLLDQLTPRSVTALIEWALRYALAHPQEITAAGLARARKGDAADRRAAALFNPLRVRAELARAT